MSDETIIPIHGPESAFTEEVLDVVERHSQRLTAYQLTGGLFAAILEVMGNAE